METQANTLETVEQPSITFLNMTGDVTITWDATNEAAVLALIEEKMKAGYSFFILKKVAFGLLGSRKVQAKSMAEVARAGSVVVDDAGVEAALAAGKVSLAEVPKTATLDTVRRAKTAQEVVRHNTVAVRRVVGG
ncbi:hypothetical protein KTD31_03390 [Burkholderia multivorans]|uniref:hypothetical protein n=1 Tax=Burkholderia multivorans TaxID=87883 RepID=UPI001C22CC55|nr:hypothetical protein [Burkholderia multivorans]MBU9200397.1 hypothetical protein [Burkholderia multivorans]MDN8078478.1 hypothetical protein [Burkholderia multivorans]